MNLINLIRNKHSRRMMLYYGLANLLNPVDWIVSKMVTNILNEKVGIAQYDRNLIFIIGPPRSGTTLIYQYMNAVCDVTYTSNLWAIFPRTSSKLKAILHITPPDEFHSFYGNSSLLKGAQEGGKIFDLWFRDGHSHYIESLELSILNNMKVYFSNVLKHGKSVCLIKNGRNSMRLKVLKKAFPNANYIRIKRNPAATAQSILKGRLDIHGSEDINWTVEPKEWPELRKLPIAEQVAKQVYFIDKQIDADMNNIHTNQKIAINYEDFCSAPMETVAKICELFPHLVLRSNIKETIRNKTFQVSAKRTVNEDIYDELKKHIDELYS